MEERSEPKCSVLVLQSFLYNELLPRWIYKEWEEKENLPKPVLQGPRTQLAARSEADVQPTRIICAYGTG